MQNAAYSLAPAAARPAFSLPCSLPRPPAVMATATVERIAVPVQKRQPPGEPYEPLLQHEAPPHGG